MENVWRRRNGWKKNQTRRREKERVFVVIRKVYQAYFPLFFGLRPLLPMLLTSFSDHLCWQSLKSATLSIYINSCRQYQVGNSPSRFFLNLNNLCLLEVETCILHGISAEFDVCPISILSTSPRYCVKLWFYFFSLNNSAAKSSIVCNDDSKGFEVAIAILFISIRAVG